MQKYNICSFTLWKGHTKDIQKQNTEGTCGSPPLVSPHGIITQQKNITMIVHSYVSHNCHKFHLHPSSVYSVTDSVGNLCAAAQMWLCGHPGLQWGISWVHIGNDEQPLSGDSSCTGHCHLPATCSIESTCRKHICYEQHLSNELTQLSQ